VLFSRWFLWLFKYDFLKIRRTFKKWGLSLLSFSLYSKQRGLKFPNLSKDKKSLRKLKIKKTPFSKFLTLFKTTETSSPKFFTLFKTTGISFPKFLALPEITDILRILSSSFHSEPRIFYLNKLRFIKAFSKN
jgi:hypothetical protein